MKITINSNKEQKTRVFTYEVADKAGNKASVTRIVRIVDVDVLDNVTVTLF